MPRKEGKIPEDNNDENQDKKDPGEQSTDHNKADNSKPDIDQLLKEWSEGDPQALEILTPLIFDDLRRLARSYFAREADDHTLQPTALVAEFFVRILERRKLQWASRVQFFAAAAEIMGRILVGLRPPSWRPETPAVAWPRSL